MRKDFVTWLNEEMNNRGWSNNELHRRSGMAQSTISMVLSGHNKPGWDFCAKIAKAFGEPPSKVFRLAGLLPPLPATEDELTQEISSLAKDMPEDKRKILALFAKFLHQNSY